MNGDVPTSMTIDSLAERWECHRDTVVRLIQARRLVAFKIGRVWRVTFESVERFEANGGSQSRR